MKPDIDYVREAHEAWLDEQQEKKDKFFERITPEIERALEKDFYTVCRNPKDNMLDYMEVDGVFCKIIQAPLHDVMSELSMDFNLVQKLIECFQKSSCIYVQSLKSMYARSYAHEHADAMAQHRWNNHKFSDEREIPF